MRKSTVIASRFALPAIVLALALGGCSHSGEIDVTSGVGITAVRTTCPSTAVVAGTGDITLFDPPSSREESAIDVSATITNLRATCDDAGSNVQSHVTFDVYASRRDTAAVRDVTLPYYSVLLRGGSQVVAKRVGQVTVHFAAGQARAQASASATALVDRAAAKLPDDVLKELNRKRKAGSADAAVDPLSTPRIRDAVRSATFEQLVGFQLTGDQLAYNATR